jgi:hypothetical protein
MYQALSNPPHCKKVEVRTDFVVIPSDSVSTSVTSPFDIETHVRNLLNDRSEYIRVDTKFLRNRFKESEDALHYQ